MAATYQRARAVALLALLLALLVGCAQAAPGTARLRLASKRHDPGESHGADDAHAEDCLAIDDGRWNKGMHIGAIFIVLATSGLGVYLPVLSHFVPRLHIPKIALTLGKHLGTGVIIATALIHMLPSASDSLGNPCVGGRMGSYSGWPGVLAIMAIFAMHLLEFVLSSHAMGSHAHSHGVQPLVHSASAAAAAAAEADSTQTASAHSGSHSEHGHGHDHSASKVLYIAGSEVDQHQHQQQPPAAQDNCDAVAVHTHHTHVHGASFLNAEDLEAAQRKVSTYILELGICSHSVIIGLTLSVTTGTDFTTLLIAIVFHQFCEGLALGSRLAEVRHRRRAFLRASISAALFAMVTPLGMVIGIGVRHSYAPSSPASLITTGVLDALSAGILLYTGLVNLLAEEFGTLEFRAYRLPKKVACFAATFIGAGAMALIGNWA
ncbi:hypothetical protein H4R18_003985 [Coemansia javaensis]|uniref:Uncharacterized protein n=1 Tax=Coemansia javaensis TaxID=2761396 RepID=A0A9W8LFJ1_9FUNG|nr:hypothetical protein H4R18_003985 [Coemansia javaensis]